MNRAAKFCVLTLVSFTLWTSTAKADVLAEYNAMGAAPNPNTQGWTWNNSGTVTTGGASLLLTGAANPPILFTETVPTNVFFAPWSFTGNIRLAGNGQEEFGRMMFVDDGTNIWHLSFFNTGNDTVDGIYNGGDPNGPVLSNTATKIWDEPVPAKPFDGFHDYAIVDTDGAGGSAPQLFLDGVAQVSLPTSPSRFPRGTIGFGSLNPNESGFFQTTRMVFEGNPNAVPEPGALVLLVGSLFGLTPFARRVRKK
jgi:hypothetical protein